MGYYVVVALPDPFHGSINKIMIIQRCDMLSGVVTQQVLLRVLQRVTNSVEIQRQE
jgi:hypothetical protein